MSARTWKSSSTTRRNVSASSMRWKSSPTFRRRPGRSATTTLNGPSFAVGKFLERSRPPPPGTRCMDLVDALEVRDDDRAVRVRQTAQAVARGHGGGGPVDELAYTEPS